MIKTLDLSKFVEQSAPGRARITLVVEGVGCASCIRKIEDGLQRLPGILDARLNFTQRRVVVEWRDGETNAERIVAAIEQIGYRAYPFAPERIAAEHNYQTKWLLKCLAVANERDVVVGLTLGRERFRYDAGNARSVSLALGFDCFAGRGLCRATFL
jgi:P-type Cu2+ transporter